MSTAQGARRFFAYKTQTAHGTRATGFTQAMVPMRNGSIFDVQPLVKARADAINSVLPVSGYYPIPKIVGWNAAFYLYNPTTAHTTIRELFRTFFGKETTAVGPPITKQFDIFDDIIDGGTDGTPANTLYGRSLTLHEQSDDTAGAAIYAHEVQDGVIEELKLTWTPRDPLMVEMTGLASDLQDGATDITPSYPDGRTFGWDHVRDITNGGLRIGTANPPTTTDNVVFSQAVLTLSQKIRYEAFMGLGTTFYVAKPIRDDQISITLDVTMDVNNAIASQYESFGAWTDWKNQTPLNLAFLTYIDANNILAYQATAATKSCFWETMKQTAQGWGAMQWQGKLRIAPAALTDSFLKLTNFS